MKSWLIRLMRWQKQLRDIQVWRDNRKDPGNWEMLSPPVAEITSDRIGTFGRIKFDVPLFW